MQTSKNTDPKLLRDCLNESSLGNLVVRAQHIMSIHKVLQIWLPNELAPHCQILNIENGTLTLAGNSAAFVTRLRYLTPELMDVLNSHDALPTIKQIIYKVIPPTIEKTIVSKKAQPFLSSTTLKLLEQTAENINHPQLKKALKNMAR